MEVIIDAKERQAAEANKNASILLQEIDLERVGTSWLTCAYMWQSQIEIKHYSVCDKSL